MDSKRTDGNGTARRKFLAQSGLMTTGMMVGAAGLGGILQAHDTEDATAPEWPWPYTRLDVEQVRKRGHKYYYEGGCMYGASGGLLSMLIEKVGYPYTTFPHDMMRYGGGGISGWGTVCGSLNGACAIITLVAGKAYGNITNELMAWYGVTPFPSGTANRYASNREYLVREYKPDAVLPTTVSNSPLCHVSVNTWCRATGFAKVADHLPLAVRRSLYNPSFEIGEERIEDWANTAVRQSEMIKKLYDNGIQLVAGSDDMPGFTIHRELELYAQAGIPNADVLKIATLDSARIVGVADQTGSIEVGKAADLVLLDGNPLEDISAIRQGVLVMKGGAIYQPNELYQAVGVEPF
ncbi:MAG: amidohydrolase family protein [Xanthomonadales bacterium]|jgi:hypothetical protein|nr:amidohydrolase family protein [Xanthomonadales bacterium]MDH3942260.1 amidohydrolase family protein [Xanthomonadales bacterium]MDH4002054.1 amidohydrolase family protein [Xanthomonadales bacterium]